MPSVSMLKSPYPSPRICMWNLRPILQDLVNAAMFGDVKDVQVSKSLSFFLELRKATGDNFRALSRSWSSPVF